ncbi:MAG: porin family protein [Candidatus Hydrogenedentes bacterium]|nr:porin family protein [Candidatus Hydrogenedentota bacterium]
MKARLTGMMIVLVLGCIAPSLAAADDLTDSYAQYIGIQVLGLLENFDDEGGTVDAENTFGLGIKYGARFDGNSDKMDTALELHLNWYDTMDVNVLGVPVEFDTLSFMVRGKILATSLGNGTVDPYAYVGLGIQFVESTVLGISVSDSALAYELGIGVEWATTDRISLFAEGGYVVSSGDLNGLDFIGVAAGINFKF